MESHCSSQKAILEELQKRSPGAPLLALGQTVFWDEPMKAGLVLRIRELGDNRPFLAGIHDTDYFAKLKVSGGRGYRAMPHNDTTTKGLWSAAGEFSCLFGSETIITRDTLQAAGAKLSKIQHRRPGYLDKVTEAWGWRGVVSLAATTRVTADKPLQPVFRELYDTFAWAVDDSLSRIAGPHRADSDASAQRLLAMVCDAADDENQTLGGYYRRLAPQLYDYVAGQPVGVQATATTELLRFNRETCHLPRFELFGLFVNPDTRGQAIRAYDDAVRGSEIYTLDRFGTGALPFDLAIPGVGRGTIRLGSRGLVVSTPTPVAVSLRKPVRTLADLAAVIEAKWGPDCVVVGKAVALIGMLAREHVFVFHAGASSYVDVSKRFHKTIAGDGHKLDLHPILRIRYEPWDAMTDCCAWLTLPEPLQRPYGVSELSAPSLARRWRQVAEAQSKRLNDLAALRRPLELIRYLETEIGGPWRCLAAEYEGMHEAIVALRQQVDEIKSRKRVVLDEMRAKRQAVQQAQQARGEHWRAQIFEHTPSSTDWAERKRLTDHLASLVRESRQLEQSWHELQGQQDELVTAESIQRIRTRRDDIAFEAEIMRLQLIREAVIARDGMEKAGHRPAAWWFPIVCPGGDWFRATMRSAEYWLEDLSE